MIKTLLAAGLLLATSTAALGNLLFTAPPRLSEAEARATYQPFIDLLSEVLEQPIDFKHPRDWIEYSRMVQAGEFQIAIDDPHFVAWRAKLGSESLYHRPIAKLAGELKYHLVVRADAPHTQLQHLNSKRICAIPSPALGAVLALKNFTNPVLQPSMLPARSDADALKRLQRGRCDGAIVNSYFFDQQLAETEKSQLRPIFTTQALPNMTLAVTPQMPKADLDKIRAAILNKRGLPAAKAIFHHFGQGLDEFLPTDAKAYQGYNILEGLLFDW